jgi:hypothetical protein
MQDFPSIPFSLAPQTPQLASPAASLIATAAEKGEVAAPPFGFVFETTTVASSHFFLAKLEKNLHKTTKGLIKIAIFAPKSKRWKTSYTYMYTPNTVSLTDRQPFPN